MDTNYIFKRMRASEALSADLLLLIGRSMPFLAEEASAIASKWRDTVQGLDEIHQPKTTQHAHKPEPTAVERKSPISSFIGDRELDQAVVESMTKTGLESLSELAASGNMRAGALIEELLKSDQLRDVMGGKSCMDFNKADIVKELDLAISESYLVRAGSAKAIASELLRSGPIESIEEEPSDFIVLTPGVISVFLNVRENQFIYTPSTGIVYNRNVASSWTSVKDDEVFSINPLMLKGELNKLAAFN